MAACSYLFKKNHHRFKLWRFSIQKKSSFFEQLRLSVWKIVICLNGSGYLFEKKGSCSNGWCYPFDRNWVVWIGIMLLVGEQYSAIWMIAFLCSHKLISCPIGQHLFDRIHMQTAGIISSEGTLDSHPNGWVCSKCSTFPIWTAMFVHSERKVPYIFKITVQKKILNRCHNGSCYTVLWLFRAGCVGLRTCTTRKLAYNFHFNSGKSYFKKKQSVFFRNPKLHLMGLLMLRKEHNNGWQVMQHDYNYNQSISIIRTECCVVLALQIHNNCSNLFVTSIRFSIFLIIIELIRHSPWQIAIFQN